MNMPDSVHPGFFEAAELPNASNKQLTPFMTGGWAGMSILYADGADGKCSYPHFADGFEGFLPNWGEGDSPHPLQDVETALRQDLHPSYQPLRALSYHVGQIANNSQKGMGIEDWELEVIASDLEELGATNLGSPQPTWESADFTDYYAQIQALEAGILRAQVIKLAWHVAAQNLIEPLYVAREAYSRRVGGSGWLAPLAGLCIDTNHVNDYTSQIHDVVPVVRQNDDTVALLRGATASLYTGYAPLQGIGK